MEREQMANESGCSGHSRATCGLPAFADEEPSEDEFKLWRKRLGVCPEASYTYFAWGQRYHLIKIGRSFEPTRRRNELSNIHRQGIEIVATVRGDFEKAYHNHFEAHRFKGEWFEPHPDILAEIARLTDHG
jgi:hypothetical protein